MNKFFKRLALLLAVLMIVSMMPVQLFADNSVIVEGQSNGTGEVKSAIVVRYFMGESSVDMEYDASNIASAVSEIVDNMAKHADEGVTAITVTLNEDVTATSTLTFANDVTFDLNGHTLTVATNGDGIVVNNAALTLTNSGTTGKYVFDCSVRGSDGIFVNNTEDGKISTLNINSDVEIHANSNVNSAVHALAKKGEAIVNINAGKIVATGSGKQFHAIHADQNSTVNINDGEFDLNVDFTSYSENNDVVGIAIYGADNKQENITVNINGGTFKVGGKNAFAQVVQVGMSNGYSKNCTVNISGGEVILNPTENGTGYVYATYKTSYATAEISGGKVSGKVTALVNPYMTVAEIENDGLTVSGGTFTTTSGTTLNVEKHLAEDATYDAETGTVKTNYVATVNGVGYATLADAIAAANGNGTVTLLTATTELVQALLDGQYGSIDGLTIELPTGDYGKLELGRATKYAGSNTEYFVGGFDSTDKNYKAFTSADEIRKYKGQSAWTPNCFYRRALKNVTIKAADGATVTIEKISADAGQIYGKADAPKYDYVLDVEIPDTNKSYYMALAWNNVTFEGINFKSSVNIESSSEKTLIDGLHFEKCNFNSGYTALAAANDPNKASKGMGIRFVSWTKTTNNLRYLMVNNCTFEDCYEGVYTNPVYGVSVTNSSFKNINHNAVAIQDVDSAVNHGVVVISDNHFENVGNRIIRFNNVGDGTTIKITGNTSVNSGDSAGEIIKATTMPDSVNVNMTSNTWGNVNGKAAVLGNGFNKVVVATVNGVGYATLADAIANATPDANGTIIYEIYGKATVDSTGWIQVARADLTGLTKVEFVGKTSDAEICITGGLAILADQKYDIDVSFEALTLSKLNPTYGGDYGHSTNYFTTWLRNTNAAENTVTYTNCTFPNGACNNQYGKTVFDGCKFTNATSGKYNFWNYGGNTEIKNSTFTGVRGIKTYNEGTLVVAPTVKIENTTFDGLTEKAAIVTSKATDITLDKVSATDCGKGFFQKDIEGSSEDEKITITANGSAISGTFNITADKTTAAAKEEFNISAGTFTSEVSSDYLADGFELKKNIDGTYGVKTASVAKIGTVEYASLDDAIAAAKDRDVIVVSAGEYKLNDSLTYTGKAFTIKAADGANVSFDMSNAVALHGAKITFEGVTFDYKTNGNYIGIQHADTLVYNNCTINGQVFLYATNETFNGCTFNQTSADAYNVWTYGAKNVEFNGCTFNCVGRCVLVYNEGAVSKTELEVVDTDFIASKPASGKAAIEIDTRFMADGATITVDGKTKADRFDKGSNSGNSLWNDKANEKASDNENVTVVVANETVYEPAIIDLDTFIKKLVASGYNFDGKLKNGGKLTVKWSPVSGCYDARTGHACTVNNAKATGNTPKRVNSGLTQFQLFEGSNVAVTIKNVKFVYEPAAFTVCENSGWKGSFTAEQAPAGQLYFMTTGNVTVDSCDFEKVVFTTFNTTGTSTVKNCTFKDVYNSYAIKDIRGENVSVTGTAIENCGGGIMVSSTGTVSNVTITGNKFNNVDTAGTAAADKVGTRAILQIASLGKYENTAFDFSRNSATSCGPVIRQLNKSVAPVGSSLKYLTEGTNSASGLYTSDSKVTYVAEVTFVDGTVEKYETLIEALKAGLSGKEGTITKLLANGTVSGVTIARIIDLNGCTLTTDDLNLDSSNGKDLIVTDSSNDKNGKLVITGSAKMSIAHKIILNAGTIETSRTINQDYGVNNTIEINGGTLILKNGATLTNSMPRTVTINGGTIIPDAGESIFKAGLNTLNVIIKGGDFTQVGKLTESTSNIKFSISGGTFSADVPEEYCAKDYYPAHFNDGTKGVKKETVSTEKELRRALYEAALDGSLTRIKLTGNIKLEMLYAAENFGTEKLDDNAIGDTFNRYKLGVHPTAEKPDQWNPLVINQTQKERVVYGAYYHVSATDERIARLVIKAGQNVVIDLNGYTIEKNARATHGDWSNTCTDIIGNYGTLEIKDSAETKGTIKGNGYISCNGAVLHNYEGGVMTVGAVNVDGNAAGMTAGKGQYVIANDGGKTIINGTNVYDTATSASLVVNTAGEITITGNATLNHPETKTINVKGGDVIIESATIISDKYSIYAAEGKTTITGEITVNGTGKMAVKGGEIVKTANATVGGVPEGYAWFDNADRTQSLSKAYAKIGETYYKSLADALAAANADDTVTLLADINTPEKTYEITKSLTIDLNGKTVTGSGYDGVFEVTGKNINVVLNATNGGKVIAVENSGSAGKYAMAVWMCGAGSTLTINGGEFIQNITSTNDKQMDMIYASAGTIIINSGSFTSGTPKWTLNIKDSAYKNRTANIIVNGGTFTDYDPRNAENEGKGTSLVADGVGIDKNADGTFTAKSGMAAQIVDADGNSVAAYATLADAIAAAKSGATVTLLDNIDISTTGLTISAERTITLDLNGHTLKVANTDAGNIKVCGKLTLKDSTDTAKNGTGTGKIYTETPYIYGTQDKVMIATMSGGEFTMESGLIDAASFTTDNANVGHFAVSVQNDNGNATVTINGGHIKAGWYAIAGNGQNSSFEGNIIVNGGILESVADYAIYHPHAGTTTINGGVVFGAAGGVSINRGKLVVNGGTITSKGTGTTGNWGDGTGNQAAAAINVNAKYETTTVEIKGGTITAEKDAILLTNGRDGSIAISGGTFSSAVPEEYCADGFIPTQNEDGTYGVKKAMKGSKKNPYTLEELGAMTRADYIEAQKALGGTMYVEIGNYSYGTNGVLGNGVRNDTPGQMPDHSKLNAYGENGYLGAENDGANGNNIIFVGGSITSGVTGYASIDNIGTSLLLAVPAYTNVTFEGVKFNNVMSFDYQLYTSPWSQLGELKFSGCTFNGLIVGAIASQTLTFNKCTFTNYINTISANNSNPTWIRPAYGNWSKGDNDGQGSDFKSLTTINFTNNTVTSTRPVKFERIAQWEMDTKVSVKNNEVTISAQKGDTSTKSVGFYFGANAKFDLTLDGNKKLGATSALYTAVYKAPNGTDYAGLPAGSTVKDSNGADVEVAGVIWKTTDALTLKTTTEAVEVAGVKFATLEEAVAAVAKNGEEVTIKLLSNITAGGIDVAAGQNIVFDFDGHTYTLDGSMVGSTGTKTNGFRFLKGSTVVLKNGTLANGNGSPAKAMINSYATLKLVDFSVDARTTAVAETGSAYGYAALYISNGVTTVTGNGNYTTSDDNFVILIANVGDYTDGASLVFDENYTGTVSGRVSTGNKQNATVEIKNGKFDLKSIDVENTNTTVTISGGKFKNIEIAGKYLDNKAFDTEADADGYYTVKDHPITNMGLSIGESLTLRITVDESYKNGKLKYTYIGAKDGKVHSGIVYRAEKDKKGNWVFRISDINAQRADVIYTVQYVDESEKEVGSAKEVSILKYCEGLVEQYKNADEAVKNSVNTLVCKLLNYSAAAMDYRQGTDKDDRYNNMTWGERATALRKRAVELCGTVTDYAFEVSHEIRDYGYDDNAVGANGEKKVGIEFSDKIRLFFNINYNENYTYTYNGLKCIPEEVSSASTTHRIYVTVAPFAYDSEHCIEISDADGFVYEIAYSLDNVLEIISEKNSGTAISNLAKATYEYCRALTDFAKYFK